MAAKDRFQDAEEDTRHRRVISPSHARSLVPCVPAPSLPSDLALPYRSLSAPSSEALCPTWKPSRSSFSDWELIGRSLKADVEHISEESVLREEGRGGVTKEGNGHKTPGQVAATLLEDHLLPPGLLPLGSLEEFSVASGEFTAVLGQTAERELSGFRIHYCSRISGHFEMGMLVQIKGIYLWDALLHLPVRMPVRKIRAHGPEVDYVDLSLGLQTIQLPKSALGAGKAEDFRWHGLPGNRDLSCSQAVAQYSDTHQQRNDTEQCSGTQSHSYGASVSSNEAGSASPGAWRHRSGRTSGIGHQRGDRGFGSPQACGGRTASTMPCRARAHRRHHSGKAILEV